MMTLVPDAASAAYALVERWCSIPFTASARVDVYIRAEHCCISVQLQKPMLLNSTATQRLDEALVLIRPRCAALNIEVHQSVGPTSAEHLRVLSMPPRATHCLSPQLGPFIMLKVSIQGWKSTTGFDPLCMFACHVVFQGTLAPYC
jgi:hypothetical protein